MFSSSVGILTIGWAGWGEGYDVVDERWMQVEKEVSRV